MNLETAASASAIASTLYGQLHSSIGPVGSTVLILSIGIALYAIVVGTFYLRLSKKVLYKFEMSDKGKKSFLYGYMEAIGFVLRYALLFPLISFLWFTMLSVLLYLLSRTISLDSAFLLAVSVVAATRICAYYDENVSVDLAKLLPLALLGVLLVDQTQFTQEIVGNRVEELAANIPRFAPFLGIAIVLEWTLRILLAVKRMIIPQTGKQ